MKKTSKTLLFFGNERLVSGLKKTNAPILRGLLERGYAIKAIISHHSDTHSRNARPLEVARIAEEHSIPLLTPEKPLDIQDQLTDLKADAAVLVAYGRIIPQKVIDIFPFGIINVHPSILPKYRGPTPIESSLLNGDESSGVSIMKLSNEMDAGPIYAQRKFSINPTDTKFDVYEKVTRLSADLLFETLPAILDGSLQAKSQDESQATYCSLFTKDEGNLDPHQMPAVEAERKVRAFLGFPRTRLVINGQPLIITKSHVSSQKETPLDVVFNDGNYLSIDRLIAPGGKELNAKDFLRGHNIKLGE